MNAKMTSGNHLATSLCLNTNISVNWRGKGAFCFALLMKTATH